MTPNLSFVLKRSMLPLAAALLLSFSLAGVPARASDAEEARDAGLEELAQKVRIVTRAKMLTAIPQNEAEAVDLALVDVPGAARSLTEGVTAKAWTRYVEVEGEMVGQLVLSGVEKGGRAEPLDATRFTSQFTLSRPELEPSAPVTIEGDQGALIAALERLAAESPEEAEDKRLAEAPAGAGGSAGSDAGSNRDAASYQTPEALTFDPADPPLVRVTTEGCTVRVDLAQMMAIQQSRVETTEGSKVTRSDCEDGNERYVLQRSYAVCGDRVDMEARMAEAQYLLFYTDAGGNRQEVNECTPDTEKAFPITEKRSACTVWLDYAKEEAVPQAALVYQNANNAEVQVRGCEPSEEVASVPLVKTQEGCTIRHDFAGGRSHRQSRHTYELEGVLWQAGACSDDGETYAHTQVYETAAGRPLCEPVVNQASGTVTMQSRVQISVAGNEQFISECRPDTTGAALMATTEGCSNPVLWTHDVAAGVSYGRERFYYLWKGAREYVSDCQESAQTYAHQVTVAGWQNHDAQLFAWPLSTVRIEGTPEGSYTILTSQILPGAEEVPYAYEGEGTAETGTSWYEGCTEFRGQNRVRHYTRPDGSAFAQVTGEAAPLDAGNKCTVSSESRTVYVNSRARDELGNGNVVRVGIGLSGTHCASDYSYCPVIIGPNSTTTAAGTYNICRFQKHGNYQARATVTHYDKRQVRSLTHFPDGSSQAGSWQDEGGTFVRTVMECGGGGLF